MELTQPGQGEPLNGRQPGRTQQLVEVVVFLFLFVPPMVVSSFASRQVHMNFTLGAWSTIARHPALAVLTLFFLWRNGEPIARIGWRFNRGWREAGLGVMLYLPFSAAMWPLWWTLRAAGLSAPPRWPPPFLLPRSTAELVLAFAVVVLVALAEETIFRGYLLLRLRGVTGSLPLAVALSALIFSLEHTYQGGAGMVVTGVTGLVLAFIYLWRKSLVGPTVMHFLQNFNVIILPHLLAIR